MKRMFLTALAALAPFAHAAERLEGRWQGTVAVPGHALAVTLDLAPTAPGTWIGSIVCPELHAAGAPLAGIELKDGAAKFAIAALGDAAFAGRIDKTGELRGDFTLAGNRAPFVLRRIGAAQVVPPAAGTPVSAAFAGSWAGQFELGGYSRQVTLRIANGATGTASAEFVVVGKRTTNVAVDLVRQEGDRVRIESSTMGIGFEGVASGGGIDATFELGPYEIPFRLTRSAQQ